MYIKVPRQRKDDATNTIGRQKCCLYPPAKLPWGKAFLQANEEKVITFVIANSYHAIRRIRDSIPPNEFLAVFASYPLQQHPHHTNPCLFCVFVPLSPSSVFLELTEFFHKKPVEDITFVSVDCPCLF